MKLIDISHNLLSLECLNAIIGQKLKENTSIVSIDIQNNPGTSAYLLKQASLFMLKNI